MDMRMRGRSSFLVVALAFVGASCRRPTGDAEVGARRAALDLAVGSVHGTVTWGGAPVTGVDATNLTVGEDSNAWFGPVGADGSYDIQTIAVGSYAASVSSSICQGGPAFAHAAVTIAAGTTSVDFDLTPTVGRVMGTLSTDGVSGPPTWFSANGCLVPLDPMGRFSQLLPAGTYSGWVASGVGQKGSFSFVVAGGQTKDLGAFFVTQSLPLPPPQPVFGHVLWNGAPAVGVEVTLPDGGLFIFNPPFPAQPSQVVDASGIYSFQLSPLSAEPLPPVTVLVSMGGCQLASAESTGFQDFDLTPTVGRVTGALTANGTPLSATLVFASCGGAGVPANNTFDAFLPSGTYAATIRGGTSSGNLALGSFSFSVAAGQTTDVGAIDVPLGSLHGNVTWNGAPLSALDAQRFVFEVGAPYAFGLNADASYALPLLPPGPISLDVLAYACAYQAVSHTPATVSAGAATTADLDITAGVGRVSGIVAVNGAPAGVVNVILNACTGFSTASDGTFTSPLLPPGSYTATAKTARGLATFSFTVIAGQTTDLGTQNFSFGDVDATAYWGGAPPTAGDDLALTLCRGSVCTSPDASGRFSLANAPAGSVALDVRGACGHLADVTATVAGGSTTNVDVDLTPAVGRIIGIITVNGATAPGADIELGSAVSTFHHGACRLTTDATGHFEALLAPGSQVATVFDPTTGHPLGTFTFTVVAGQTTDVDATTTSPDQDGGVDATDGAVDTTDGAVEAAGPVGTPLGEPCAGGGECASPLLCVDGVCCENDCGQGDPNDCQACSTTAGGRTNGRCTPSQGSTPCKAPGECAAPESCDGTSRDCPGLVFLSGAACAGTLDKCEQARTCGGFGPDCDMITYKSQGTVCDSSPDPCIADSKCTGATGGCPALQPVSASDCANVVSAGPPTITLNGGSGNPDGVTITFVGGITGAGRVGLKETDSTVVVSPAPDRYQVLGPPGQHHYWDIQTDAQYVHGVGNIKVCVYFDKTWLTDQTMVNQTYLEHWDAAGLGTNVGTFDVSDPNEICGYPASLSPFALVAPSPTALPVLTAPAAVTAEANGPAGATVSYSVTAQDPKDGSLTPDCVPASGSTFPIGTTMVSCKATNLAGIYGLASFAVAVNDTKGPIWSNVPADMTVFATSTAGAKVTYTAPTAIDAVDGKCSASCTLPSGSTFGPGKNTVTCTASDQHGHASSASFGVWVQYQAPTDGTFFLAPIRVNGSSIFQVGRPVPVRFKLTGASAGIKNLVAKLVVTKLSSTIQGSTVDTSDETDDDTNFIFQYRPLLGIYAYRWRTRDQAQGTYQLRADLGDAVTHQINVSLKVTK
jgi:hypothetical protein